MELRSIYGIAELQFNSRVKLSYQLDTRHKKINN